jgi:hypothetical protein
MNICLVSCSHQHRVNGTYSVDWLFAIYLCLSRQAQRLPTLHVLDDDRAALRLHLQCKADFPFSSLLALKNSPSNKSMTFALLASATIRKSRRNAAARLRAKTAADND